MPGGSEAAVDPIPAQAGPAVLRPDQVTLAQCVRQLAETIPDRPSYTFVDYLASPRGLSQTLTWGEVDMRARALAAALRSRVLAGQRAAVLAPQGLDFVVAMLGAFYARVVAIPLFTPDLPGHSGRLRHILADADPACVLTTEAAAASVEALLRECRARPRHTVIIDTVSPALADGWRYEEIGPDDLAYLQYTSGSTRAPAGVMITHGCLAANAAQISTALGVEPYRSTAVGWLPLFHDMGFVMTVAMPIATGCQAAFMDPVAFLMRPVRWLQLASEHANVFTAGPNFAYEYCVNRIGDQDRAGLDLSGVRAFINGAEPVRPATLRRFTGAFAACGLAAEALTPAYGLAEATLYVASGGTGRPPRTVVLDRAALQRGEAVPLAEDAEDTGAVPIASCGFPAGQHVAIVDPQTAAVCPAGRIGEIWVSGPNVSPGYFRDLSRAADMRDAEERDGGVCDAGTFGAALADAPEGMPRGGWLRTGDTGVMHDGELLVTGRLKDLIIIDGRNHYPHDVEATAQDAHPVIRRDRVAAFAAPGVDGDRLVVVAERSRQAAPGQVDPAEVTRAVRAAVSAQHGAPLREFLLVPPGDLPRTSSGKIARSACRDRYLAGAFAGDRE
jgi:fatty acid CoA ligase FadD32